jgi:hypothetical protein
MSAGGGVTAVPGWAENGGGAAATSRPAPTEGDQAPEAKGKSGGAGRRRRGSPTTGRKKAGGATNGGGRK